MISETSSYSEQEQIIKERYLMEEKLRRLGKACIDGLIEENEYNLQRKLIKDKIESLVIPRVDATIKAGELVENLGQLWEKATIEERHELLSSMLDAVYVDLWANRSVVGIQPKPPFYPLFQSLKQDKDSKVTIFDPSDKIEPPRVQKPEAVAFRCGGGGGELNSPSRKRLPEYPTSLVSSSHLA